MEAVLARGAALAALVFVSLAPEAAAKGKRPAEVMTPLGREVHEAVLRAGGPDFWGTVLVAKGGEVLLAKGYGFADYRSRPNAPDTLHELASASKQVTAAAVLRLEQQKRLKTTDRIDRFFPDCPKDKRAITVDDLLHHTAGLSPDVGVPYSWQGSRDAWLREVLGPPLVADPGAKFAYSNAGYALLAAVVEVASGRSFEDYARRELFAPAGMDDTGFVGEDRLVRTGRASVRRCDDCQPDWTAASWFYGWGYRGMGGVVSTAWDLLAWDRALRGDKVLGATARQKLHTPALERYACGWLVGTTDRGTTKAEHSGSVRGYGVQIARWLEDDALVVVLSNGKSDMRAVEAAAARVLFPPAPLVLELDVEGETLNAWRAVEWADGLAWRVAHEGDGVVLRLRRGARDVATLRMGPGTVRRLAEDLRSALAASAYPSPEEPAAVAGGVYLGQAPGAGTRARLDKDLEVRVLPRYEGRDPSGQDVTDLRTLLVVALPGGWPLMVKMNPAAVRALGASLAPR